MLFTFLQLPTHSLYTPAMVVKPIWSISTHFIQTTYNFEAPRLSHKCFRDIVTPKYFRRSMKTLTHRGAIYAKNTVLKIK